MDCQSTNELLRQHEQDIKEFIEQNDLSYIVLRLDAAMITSLGQQYLSEKFTRQGDRLHQMLEDPGSVLTASDGHHIDGHHPYVLVINPDIFYYALYGLGNPHDQKVLFRSFMLSFQYIIVDEFHYYNAKQLANFLFFLTLSREWGYFALGRKVCLLTATPSQKVKDYLAHLNIGIVYIDPGNEPADLPTTPALAPVRLRLWGASELDSGLVSLADSGQSQVTEWLAQGRHGAFISSALWRINALYQLYGGKSNSLLGRLTGAETSDNREQHKLAALLMATPTVDIGYNFSRPGKQRQSIDFLFFDAHSSDEFIQRLGRAGRVLGKLECDYPSDVWAVVPDELVTALREQVGEVQRRTLNRLVNETLPQKNGIYAYIHSGAIAEAFLPLYRIHKALPTDERQKAEQLYMTLQQVYDAKNARSFNYLANNIRKYLAIKAQLPELLKEAQAKHFTFGPASVKLRTLDEQPEISLEDLERIDAALAKSAERKVLRNHGAEPTERKRRAELEEYYVTDARFNFRDNFQPPLALAYDPEGFLATAEYTTYSALHIVQNYRADWFDGDQQRYTEMITHQGKRGQQILLYCQIRSPREQRLHLYFKLSHLPITRRHWEEHYCSKLAALEGFQLYSDDGPIPAEINTIFGRNYVTFYAVPAIGPEALALTRLHKTTALFTNTLKIDFAEGGEHEYMLVVGTAALLVACERSIINARYMVKRAATRGSHIFDWNEEL